MFYLPILTGDHVNYVAIETLEINYEPQTGFRFAFTIYLLLQSHM